MTNRCPKCDNDRFMMDEIKKGKWDLHLEKITITDEKGETVETRDAAKCSWCGHLVPLTA